MKRSKSLSPPPSCSVDTKKAKVEEEELRINGIVPSTCLLDFSDDVLLHILNYLHPQDLMALSLCCQRLSLVTKDRTLWRTVDFRSTPMLMDDLEKYIQFLHPMTTTLAVRGHPNNYMKLSETFLSNVKNLCTQLKELTIENYWINKGKIQVTDFPKTIEKLSLKGCNMGYLQSDKSYFFKMDLHMPNLTCLILSNCQWLSPHSLLVISKIPKLKELRLNSCHGLGECVAYASLATRFGFKTLEILDLRDTALGNSEVGCFSSTKTLKHLYLECSPSMRITESAGNSEPPRQPQYLHPPQLLYEDDILRMERQGQEFILEGDYSLENNGHQYGYEPCLISDRAIYALFSDTCDRRVINNSPQGIIVLEEDRQIFNNPQLRTLVVRNYWRITNRSLHHLASHATSLEHLDVTGTSVTKDGIQTFKSEKPNVTVVSSFNET